MTEKLSSWRPMLVAWMVANSFVSPGARAQSLAEYDVKAAFLFNFVKFVEWPPEASPAHDDPINLCVIGEDPFGAALEQTLQGKTISGRELVVKRFKEGKDARGCQVAFISSSERKRFRPILKSLKGSSVLTVGDSEGFARLGGVINFTLVDNKVRFEINVDAAERSRLKISSKLLSLAKVVRDEDQGGKS